ncbi:MAG: hypothetical protein MUF00_11240 [Gemmatimonadaceae bacterium]|jgi:hypothetical protein|nr:hypothetical protein [Gemmatimonadaceae bacterium]
MRQRALLFTLSVCPALLLAQPRRELNIRIPEAPQGVRLDTIGRTTKIGAPEARTFDAVVKAYEEFGIARNTESRANGEVGNTALVVRRQFANDRLSRAMDCGRGITGDYADQYRMTLALVTWVRPFGAAGDSATVHTAIVGGGRATDGTTAWPMQCASLGRFEAKLADRVKQLVREP